MIKLSLIRWCIIPFLVLAMAGCSGTAENSSSTVSGVAAAGSALVGTAYLKDSSVPAKELSSPLAADGSFVFNLNGLTAPYILKATGTANGRTFTLYSFAPTAGIANINPLSSLAMILAYGSDDLQSIYDSPDFATMLVIMNSLPSAITNVQTALHPTLVKFGAGTVNFISDPYVANHQGIDLFLDNAIISTSNGVITLYDLTTNRAVQTTLNGFNAGTFDFILNPITTAGTVCISPTVSSMNTNASRTFTSIVIGSNDQGVTWSVVEANGGSITNGGVYTAPATAGTYHVKATSRVDSTKSATATIEVKVSNFVYIVPSGPGEYSVMASNFSNVGGAEVTIAYDTNSLVNPRITQGTLIANTMFVQNLLYSANSVKFAFMSLKAISGSGTLATISFDLLGATPGSLVVTAQKISSIAPPPPPGSVVTVPAPDQPPSSPGGSVPSTSGSGSTSGTSTP